MSLVKYSPFCRISLTYGLSWELSTPATNFGGFFQWMNIPFVQDVAYKALLTTLDVLCCSGNQAPKLWRLLSTLHSGFMLYIQDSHSTLRIHALHSRFTNEIHEAEYGVLSVDFLETVISMGPGLGKMMITVCHWLHKHSLDGATSTAFCYTVRTRRSFSKLTAHAPAASNKSFMLEWSLELWSMCE